MAAVNTQPSKLVVFEHLSKEAGAHGPRLGHLSFQGRAIIDTPHLVAVSSRGAVPHLSQDTMRDNTSIKAVYIALEDCEYNAGKFCMLLCQNHADTCALTGARKS